MENVENLGKVEQVTESGCWIWMGSLQSGGYGTYSVKGKNKLAHRWFYEVFKGPIPEGLHIDHLCSVRCCVNPLHLDVVTFKENIRRGNERKLNCKQYHPFYGNNIYISSSGQRRCRKCNADSHRRQAKREGRTLQLQNKLKTFCPKGYEYTLKNTRLNSGGRICKECHRIDEQRRYQEILKPLRPVIPKRTQCYRGHEYTEDNTYIRPNGSRMCRLCRWLVRAD